MSAFSAVAIWLNWRTERRLMPYATAVMMATLAFFIGLVLAGGTVAALLLIFAAEDSKPLVTVLLQTPAALHTAGLA